MFYRITPISSTLLISNVYKQSKSRMCIFYGNYKLVLFLFPIFSFIYLRNCIWIQTKSAYSKILSKYTYVCSFIRATKHMKSTYFFVDVILNSLTLHWPPPTKASHKNKHAYLNTICMFAKINKIKRNTNLYSMQIYATEARMLATVNYKYARESSEYVACLHFFRVAKPQNS